MDNNLLLKARLEIDTINVLWSEINIILDRLLNIDKLPTGLIMECTCLPFPCRCIFTSFDLISQIWFVYIFSTTKVVPVKIKLKHTKYLQ